MIRSSRFFVIRCTRGSSRGKSLFGGFLKPGGVDRTMLHQQVAALKTTLPFAAV